MLLYIHGFNSGAASPKAQRWQAYYRQNNPQETLLMPQLPACPEASMAILEPLVQQALAKGESLYYLGSSLGGYYATYLRETYGGKAVLINPAAQAHQVMLNFVGRHTNPYTGELVEVKPEHAQVLERFDRSTLKQPKNYLVFLETGDQVLDYRKAQALYQDSHLEVIEGGSHSFEYFEHYLPKIGCFLQEQTVLELKN